MRTIAFTFALVLAACGSETEERVPEARDDAAMLDSAPAGPTPEQLAQLENRDCRAVTEAYSAALKARQFEFAARFWDDPVIDDERLEALFSAYAAPVIEIAEVREEELAGALHCTVTGALKDAADQAKPLRQGKIVLHRAGDVTGAGPRQVRWTIRSSTFVEPMERSGKGEPA